MIPRLSPLVLLLLPAPALAQADFTMSPPPALCFAPQPELQPETEPSAPPEAPMRRAYGAEGSEWLTFGLGYATDFGDVSDYDLHAAYSWFLIEDVEFALEAHLWYFDQPGDNAYGLNPALNFRWHFTNNGRWTTYVDLGIGLLLATDEVPADATEFGFMPRAGIGATYLISEADQVRLQMGLRWHHISNARITGDERNPGRDSPFFYAGVIFPF